MLASAALLSAAAPRPAPAGASGAPPLVRDPSALVDPFAGTGTGAVSPGSIGEYPGADVPFGMVQWSPDTTPDRISGSGYAYRDTHISGFSLTHLSGTGCAAYGDVPVLPTVGPLGAAPWADRAPFSHAAESAAPGRYAVTLDHPAIGVALAVTTRTGLARFRFPRTAAANVVLKVSGSANPVTASAVDVVGNDAVTGEVTSGQFCGTGTPYTLYFAAHFDRPFTGAGTWSAGAVHPGSTTCTGQGCGAWVTFDGTADPVVEMKVGVSYVSVAGAEANLAAEDPGWSLARVEAHATGAWNALLDRIAVAGGTRTEQRIFYTALYHSLLFPSVISDDDGAYTGDDHRVHVSSRPQYSNFSEWDVYRSEIELLSLVAPAQTADMVQSLVTDAQQNGWLPKWAIADGDASQMNGDSADPLIAAAYAFGVRGFDARAALAAMVKGATQEETGHGLEIERQYLSQYLSQHYVNAGSLDLTSIDYSIGGSVTLEYALDDFAIAQLAAALGDRATAAEMMARAQNWQYLFDPATGAVGARNADGSFPPGPAFQRDLFEPGGELGFEEGNALQYTWSVPQDLYALGNLMGGGPRAVAALDRFFTHLNAGRFAPYDWAGNEPGLWTPWEYDWFGAPWRTQGVVRRIMTTLYHDAPVDEPGNDDLGAISSWYVWAAMGLYPVTPGTADLALASPLFPEVSVTLPDGRRLVLSAPGASASRPYVHALTVTGPATHTLEAAVARPACSAGDGGRRARAAAGAGNWQSPWLPAAVLSTGATLRFTLAAAPDRTWAADPARAPPSYTADQLPALGFTQPNGATTVAAGGSAPVVLGLQQVSTGGPEVRWSASATPGLTVSPESGVFAPARGDPGGARGPGSCQSPAPLRQTLRIGASAPGAGRVVVSLETAAGAALPPVLLDVKTP